MDGITQKQVLEAIFGFLAKEKESKCEKKRKDLVKKLEVLERDGNVKKCEALKSKLNSLENEFTLDVWMENAANNLVGRLKYGSHISKGIHSSSDGNNIHFSNLENSSSNFAGTHSLDEIIPDANGDAAALPVASLFEIVVCSKQMIRVRDLIRDEHEALEGVFSSDVTKSSEYAKRFKSALDNVIENPATYELNKQLLWPMANAISDDTYVTIVPLYPSSLTSRWFSKINDLRFSEENKAGRDSRKKKPAEHLPYISIPEIAVLVIGGANAQNVGKLVAARKGRDILLPSFPPVIAPVKEFRLSQRTQTLFDSKLAYYCRNGFRDLYEVLTTDKNVVDVREARKDALDLIIAMLFELVEFIKKTYAPGWSKNYELPMAEKYWLDPYRSDLEGETDFAEGRVSSDWPEVIVDKFALWVNERLQKKFTKLASDIGDAEYKEWQREIEHAIKASLRAGKETFV